MPHVAPQNRARPAPPRRPTRAPAHPRHGRNHTNLNAPLQSAWVASTFPRAAEIIRHTYGNWSARGVARFEAMLQAVYLPWFMQPHRRNGSSTNGNWGLAMAEAGMNIGVFTGNRGTIRAALALWRARVPAYFYEEHDGASPRRPADCRDQAGTAPRAYANSTDAEMVAFWHGQAAYGPGRSGICQESCRDLGHVQGGIASAINMAETAHHQGIDLYAEMRPRLVASLELTAGMVRTAAPEPAPRWLCSGAVKGVGEAGETWEIAHHHFTVRCGVPLPNVARLLPEIRPTKAGYMACWETLTHGGARGASPCSPRAA